MTSLAVTGIRTLATCDESRGRGPLGLIDNAVVVSEERRVIYAGPAGAAASLVASTAERFDVDGRCVMPGFVDSHTHLVFAGDRSGEFSLRMAGRPYQPGGILETVAATRAATPDLLAAHAGRLVRESLATGTTTVEVKTGYGLDPEHEALHLRIAARLTPEVTFLGAHLVPGTDRDGYLRLLIEEMVPAAAGVARWCDVFCEAGAFDVDESRAVLQAAKAAGLGLRVHANQLGPGGGVGLACELGAASADHCTHLAPADVEALAASATVATLLPLSDFCTRQPYPDGRALLDAGATVALASNCNPGSSYSTSIPLVLALAVRECGLTLDEAVLAATRGGAAALRRTDIGNLGAGTRADLIVLDAPHPSHLVYRLGTPLVSMVVKDGGIAYSAASASASDSVG
ncbi:MAG: imidazolonepropionase [Acidimicrobiales bacterium]